MPAHPDRRTFLGTSAAVLGTSAAAAASASLLGVAGPASASTQHRPGLPHVPAAPGITCLPDPPVHLPPIPGMLGNRRANEMWYQMDQKTLYAPVPGIVPAYLAINTYAAKYGGVDIGPLVVWLMTYKANGYPQSFRKWATPIRKPIAFISNVLLSNFDDYYSLCSPNLVNAFAWFGEGVLFDPRRIKKGDPVHTMDSYPPIPYPVWYAYARAMMVLGISPTQWEYLAKLIGYACAVQIIAHPSQKHVNPPLKPWLIRQMADVMLSLDISELDRYFADFPYPPNLLNAMPKSARRSSLLR